MNPLQPWSAATSTWVRNPSKVTPALSSTHGPSMASSRSAQAWWHASRSVRSSTGNSTFMMSVPTSWKLRAEAMTLRRRRSRTSGSSIDSPVDREPQRLDDERQADRVAVGRRLRDDLVLVLHVGGVAVLAVEDHELGGVGTEQRESLAGVQPSLRRSSVSNPTGLVAGV